MAHVDPVFLRDERAQIPLDFDRVRFGREAQAHGDAAYVRVHHDAARDAVCDAEHHVGSLARDAGQGDELLDAARYFTAEVVRDRAAGRTDGFGFVTEKAGGFDELFELARIGVCELCGRGVARKQRGRDLVDGAVGALRGEDGRDQQLPGVLVVELNLGGRDGLAEPRCYLASQLSLLLVLPSQLSLFLVLPRQLLSRSSALGLRCCI